MKHLTVLIIKFIAAMIAFAVGLDLFFDATIVDILSFSFILTVFSYILGDLIVLPALGNVPAAVVDFVLTYMSVWIFGSVLLNGYIQIAWGSVISAIIITAVEVPLHRYLLSNVIKRNVRDRNSGYGFNRKLAYGTEFSEENAIPKKPKKEDSDH
ncbi:YndM family protein [Metabacillus sp. RGM 3146]|uniref:YndM family protein n=1 Tax=Metabacillus sp. RGM 3146 TaxID=3401092 RepID=UPI003B9B79F4